jgi:hypothetical protein
VISESIEIPPHLSLPAFQHSGLSLSREQQAPGYIENGKKQQEPQRRCRKHRKAWPDLYRQMDAEDPLLAERKALPARGAAPQRWKRFPAHAYQNSAQSGIHGIDQPARDQIEGQGLRVFVDQDGKDDHRASPEYVPLGQTIQQGCERRRASSESASQRLGTRMFSIARQVRGWQAEVVPSAQKSEDFSQNTAIDRKKDTN